MATFGSRVVLGSRVTVTGKKGVVKFIGPTDFAAGDWIGVELDLNEGKNNGIVNGVQYFDCREGHGLFVKKAQVRLDRAATSSTTSGGTPGAKPSSTSAMPTGSGRASSRLQAIREKNKALKETRAAGRTSPQPHGRASGSSTWESRSVGGDLAQEEFTALGSPASVASIGSIGSEAGKAAHNTLGERHDLQMSSPRPARGIRQVAEGRPHKASGEVEPTTPLVGDSRAVRTTGIPSARRHIDRKNAEHRVFSQSRDTSPMPPPPSRPMDQSRIGAETEAPSAKAAGTSKVEETCCPRCRELEEKLSLQKKSENTLGEERLKASMLAKEKAAAAAAGRREADMECQISELTDTCEALTLDKEQLALEKEDLQEKVDEIQMELESMKIDLEHAQLSAKENEAAARALSAAGGDGGDGSVDVKMLAEQNVQLKEALKRLHTHSIAEKTDLTKTIRSLEKEAAASATLRDEVDKLRSWKQAKAAEIEDLMEKLDESKAYEEMVESLTTKNLEIGERCGELEATIADLESSVEMSEELEIQQAEDIRELQGELTGREVSLHNQKLALESVVKELQDAKQTIERFRKYADQLKASRDALAVASQKDGTNAALTTQEKRALLTQKASIEKMATEARRAKMSEKLLQVDLLDAQARSSRVSMLLPGSLELAETELRCIDTDLSLCRLVKKAGIALELLEVPTIEFVDTFAVTPNKGPSMEGDDAQGVTELDRATAIEDCSRLALEAEQALPIARTVGEALAVLSSTVSSGNNLSPQEISAVSSEVASAVVEAEELVDKLLSVIQDEGGLHLAECATTIAALAATAKRIGIRRAAAETPRGSLVSSDDGTVHVDQRESGGKAICSAVTAVQDCIVCARRAILAVTGVALRGTESMRVSSVLLSQREDGASMLWQSVRGLWSDLVSLRNVVNTGGGSVSRKVEQLALGGKCVLEEITNYSVDTGNGHDPFPSDVAHKVATLRLAAKELLRSPLISPGVCDGELVLSPCPRVIWRAVAPLLTQDTTHSAGDSNEDGGSISPPCVPRAEIVRASFEEAIDLKPELVAARERVADLTNELVSKGKESTVATSKREQLEALLEKAEGSKVMSTDLQSKVVLLQERSKKLEQENKFMAEALEDLQDSTSRLEAENRILKKGASPKGPDASGRSSEQNVATVGAWSVSTTARLPGREGSATNMSERGASATGSATASHDVEESLSSALKWSRAEVARWRGRAFTSVLSGLKPLPHLSPAQGGRPKPSLLVEEPDKANPGLGPPRCGDTSASLRELLTLSKKLEAVRGPPRVVKVQGTARSGVSFVSVPRKTPGSDNQANSAKSTLSSAGAEWHMQQVQNARLEKEWRQSRERAAKALNCLLASGNLGPNAFQSKHQEPYVRVARLRLPSGTLFQPSEAEQAVVPVMLGRCSFEKLHQALTI